METARPSFSSDCSTNCCEQDSPCSSPRSSHSDIGDLVVDTLTIIDWDDTLFPTSWMQDNDLLVDGTVLSNEQREQLQMLAERVRLTLEAALQEGKVVIVTNAEQGWIERTCERYMPSLVSLVKTIDLVSARSTYRHCADTPSEWKMLAFAHELDLLRLESGPGRHHNILSIGDSLHELNALMSVTEEVLNCWGKSVKLLDSPSIEQLIEQHEVLWQCFIDVVQHKDGLDVEIGADN